jgi:hypothetical protein
MNWDKVAKKIAQIFEETDADQISELSVAVNDAEPIAAALKRLGLDVSKSEPRFADVERKNLVRYALTITRGAQWRGGPGQGNGKRDARTITC